MTGERLQDYLAMPAVLEEGSGITITQVAPGDPVVIASTGGYTDEQVRDVIGAALVAGSNITLTVNDVGDTITIAASSGSSGTASAMKTADESVTSSTTLQNDDHLLFAAGANETWMFTCYLHVTNPAATGDIKLFAFGPSGATVRRVGVIGPNQGATASESGVHIQSHTTVALGVGVPAVANLDAFIIFEAVVSTAATAGNIGLQWAQNTSDANATTVKQYSSLVATKLA